MDLFGFGSFLIEFARYNLERDNDEIKQSVNEREIDLVVVLRCSENKQAEEGPKKRELSSKLMKVFQTRKKSLDQRMKEM